MPVSGNEEPGVLARQSSNSSSGIPIKKRWYSMFQPPSPILAEPSSFSNENESFQPPSPILAEPSSFSNENESKTKCSGLSQGSTLNSCGSTGKSDTSKDSLVEVKEERLSGAKVDSQLTMLPFLSISPETNPSSTSGASRIVDDLVKPALTQKIASQEAIGTTVVTAVKKEVIAKQGESHSKLELPADSGHVELSLGPKNPHVSSLVDPNAEGSCLMLGAVNPSLLSLSLNKGKDIFLDGSCKNGLNNNDADDTARSNRSNWDLNTSMDSWEGSGEDVPVQDASQIDRLCKTSSSLEIKPPISSASVIGSYGDKGKQVVGASEQEFNFPISMHPSIPYKPADVLHLSLGSTVRGFDSSVLQSLDRNMNSPTCTTVKSEAVVETLIQANAGTVVRPGGTFEGNVVKPEVVKQNLQSIELSTDGPLELLEQKPMKCEPLKEISMTSDVIAHQSVGTVLQLRESSSFDHTDIAAENANFDGETISISAGTEEECHESDDAFAEHVDTVREDEEYEDGEIREPMMQSIAEGMNSVHTESRDDFVKRCDEKAEKMNLRSPLLHKEEKTDNNATFSSNYRPVTHRSLSSRSGREMPRSLSSRSGREMHCYMEEEKFHLPRNRDEMYGYGPKRFQDRSFGSSRGNFMRGRGRGSGRFHKLGRDWYSGRDFECHGGVADYRFRHKRISPWIDGATFASNRRRKPLNDGPDGHFVQGNTRFTAMQRRGFPRMQLKSPVRSPTWSSPQRRLTEGFNGHQNSSQHRSPVMHREDRMRSSFTEEAIAPQRSDSPSYTARGLNDMTDVDAVQEHVHPRSLSSRRSPPDPVYRSVEILHHQETAELHNSESTDETRMYGEWQGGPRQMRNVEEQEDELDVSKLKKRRF